MVGAQYLRRHVLVFSEPELQFLVPPPVTRVASGCLVKLMILTGVTLTYSSTAAICCFTSAVQL